MASTSKVLDLDAMSNNTIRLVEHMKSTRTSAKQYSVEAARAKLSIVGTVNELLTYGDFVRPYLDFDRHFDHEPTEQEMADAIRHNDDGVFLLFQELKHRYMDKNGLTSRSELPSFEEWHQLRRTKCHRWKRENDYILSFHTVIPNFKTRVQDMPIWLEAASICTKDRFFDATIYPLKNCGETSLMKWDHKYRAVNQCKHIVNDPHPLEIEGDYPIDDFIVQNVADCKYEAYNDDEVVENFYKKLRKSTSNIVVEPDKLSYQQILYAAQHIPPEFAVSYKAADGSGWWMTSMACIRACRIFGISYDDTVKVVDEFCKLGGNKYDPKGAAAIVSEWYHKIEPEGPAMSYIRSLLTQEDNGHIDSMDRGYSFVDNEKTDLMVKKCIGKKQVARKHQSVNSNDTIYADAADIVQPDAVVQPEGVVQPESVVQPDNVDGSDKEAQDFKSKTMTLIYQLLLFQSFTHTDTAKIVKHLATGRWVYCGNKTWYRYDQITGLWQVDGEALKLREFISSDVFDAYNQYMYEVKNMADEERKKGNGDKAAEILEKAKIIKTQADKLKNVSFKDNVEKECRTIMYNNEFIEKLDNYPVGCLPFQNGMLNAATGEIHPFKMEDYVSNCMKRCYKPKSEFSDEELQRLTELKDCMQKFLPNRNVRRFVMRAFGKALFHGRATKGIFVCSDAPGHAGDSGKSLFLKIMLKVFGMFSTGAVQNDFWTGNRNSGGNAHEEHIVAMKGMRLNGADETRSTSAWNIDLIKRLGDSRAKIQVRGCGGKMEVFEWLALNWINCNHGQFPSASIISDQNVIKRIYAIIFSSRFLDRTSPAFKEAVANGEENVYESKGEDYIDYMIDAVHEMTYLLVLAYQHAVGGDMPIPDEVVRDRDIILKTYDECSSAMETFFDERVSTFDWKWDELNDDEKRAVHCEVITVDTLAKYFAQFAEDNCVNRNLLRNKRDRIIQHVKSMDGVIIKSEWDPRVNYGKLGKKRYAILGLTYK